MSKEFENAVLDQLRASGSDTTKPHNFEFYIYLPSQVAANEAAGKILQSGFTGAEVSASGCGASWLCLAKKTLIPDETNLADHARFFMQVAAALNGEFDGWEAEIVNI
jgi:hypothetical protein